MSKLEDLNDINEYVKEYLRHHGMLQTAELMDQEIKSKQMPKRLRNDAKSNPADLPRLEQLFSKEGAKSKVELNLQKDFKDLNKKYNMIIQGARQMFSVSINFISNLMQVKEVCVNENVVDLLESYKIQLGKYHKIVIDEGKLEGNELLSETVMQEHKQKFLKNLKEENIDLLVEVLLSLRVNALQIAPELRKNLVYELIRNDIFNIEADNNFRVLTKILKIDNSSLKHAITSLISVIASTLKGVEYLTHNSNMDVIRQIIAILKSTENGSVTQRFCIAILQKCSVKDTVIPTLIEQSLIFWCIDLINQSLNNKIHIFCLDFASALLANIMHSPTTIAFLENNMDIARKVLENLLALIKAKIPVSVLMHVLIAISYVSKDNFSILLDELKFVEKISKFVEMYSQINTVGEIIRQRGAGNRQKNGFGPLRAHVPPQGHDLRQLRVAGGHGPQVRGQDPRIRKRTGRAHLRVLPRRSQLRLNNSV